MRLFKNLYGKFEILVWTLLGGQVTRGTRVGVGHTERPGGSDFELEQTPRSMFGKGGPGTGDKNLDRARVPCQSYVSRFTVVRQTPSTVPAYGPNKVREAARQREWYTTEMLSLDNDGQGVHFVVSNTQSEQRDEGGLHCVRNRTNDFVFIFLWGPLTPEGDCHRLQSIQHEAEGPKKRPGQFLGEYLRSRDRPPTFNREVHVPFS